MTDLEHGSCRGMIAMDTETGDYFVCIEIFGSDGKLVERHVSPPYSSREFAKQVLEDAKQQIYAQCEHVVEIPRPLGPLGQA